MADSSRLQLEIDSLWLEYQLIEDSLDLLRTRLVYFKDQLDRLRTQPEGDSQ